MKIAICAALYEAGRPYLADFTASVGAAAAGRPVRFVGAVDGLVNAPDALADLAARLDVRLVEVPPGHTPAGVRRAMLAAAQASGADILVFADMDDMLAADALDLHVAALADADFSYGDLTLTDAAGKALGRRFFAGADVPDRIDGAGAIAGRNFLGFSNTAVIASRLTPVALMVPEDIVAADWWFFTMLALAGLKGQKTAAPVAAYRMHDANTLGAGAPRTRAQAIAQADALVRHYQAFRADPAMAARLGRAVELRARLGAATEPAFAAATAAPDDRHGIWFDGLARLAARLDARPRVAVAAH